MQYEFTLITDRMADDEQTDQLFELAHGDMTPEGGPNSGAVMVLREADSLFEAIASAVPDVESVGLAVEGVRSEDLVSLKDIAARVGKSYEAVRLMAAGKRGKGGFPTPDVESSMALYSWTLVAEWLGRDAEPFGREIAAADHALRARRMMTDRAHRHQVAELIDA